MPPYPSTPRPGPGNYVETPRAVVPVGPGFSTSVSQRPTPTAQNAVAAPAEELTSAERAARDINRSLAGVNEQYSLEQEYGGRLAYNYEVRGPNSPWIPFQKVRSYPIPDQIFEQLNRSQVAMNMGLFAELNFAWASIDNALYLWDYTQNIPELLGFEDQPYSISTVQLAKPKPGVFLDNIKHMIVLASTDQMMLLGLGKDPSTAGDSFTLYQTGMAASVKGLHVNNIVCSAKTGRVFFSSDTDNDVRELRYQAQDSWFTSRCSVTNHTHTPIQQFTVALNVFTSKSNEYTVQLEVDDTRNVLYTLSSQNTIRAFYISADGTNLEYKAQIDMKQIHRSLDFSMQNGPLSDKTKLVSISALSQYETQSWVLMATTREGYRVYLSGGFTYYEPRILISLSHSHIRTPPLLSWNADPAPTSVGQINNYLTRVTTASRFPPGYFFCSIERTQNAPEQSLFISVPDSHPDPQYIRPQQGTPESATWIQERDLRGQVMSIGFTEPYKGATSYPQGFGYELAVQFDQPIPEVAVLTNFGIHILRRRRFVDSLAALIRSGGGQEGFQTEIQNLIVKYGRQEVLADSLAAACGQSVDTAMGVRINDPDVLEIARKIFIDHGGRPIVDQGRVNDLSAHIDAVRPSPRHDGAVRYVGRLVRSTWKHVIVKEDRSPAGYQILSAVKADKLRSVQENLLSLQKFFKTNKAFIRGLSGPDDLARQPQASRDDELALQGEHRALTALVKFVSEMIEAISFVLVLFEEKVVELIPLLPEQSRSTIMTLTYEQLVSTKGGNSLARDLVKAIVNRNIARGSNIETIAEALRRKCGNFCSADDVIIFKAQEQLRRAAEAKANAEYSRNLLNESLKLFEEVAGSLPQDYLHSAINEYIELQFFAGAIQLALKVAYEKDKTNDALAWMSDGRVETDPRRRKFEDRNRCYDMIHTVLEAIDSAMKNQPSFVDGRPSLCAIRRDEAYEVISRSKDEVFLTNLYDWYLSQQQYDRLLSADSAFIVTYLQRRSTEDVNYADLLWKYYGNNSQFHEAAKVQFQLAQSAFTLTVHRRLEYLSLARANASAFTTANNTQNRKTKQKLLTDINTLIEVANIQEEILTRLQGDSRLKGEQRTETLKNLDGPILSISDLFNKYADAAHYFDICLFIYALADHRDASQIKITWSQYLDNVYSQAQANTQNPDQGRNDQGEPATADPWETMIADFRLVAGRLRNYEAVFSVPMLMDMLEQSNVRLNAAKPDDETTQAHWIPNVFIDLEIPYETIYDSLESIFLTYTQPGSKLSARRIVLRDLLHVVERWMQASYTRAGSMLFGTEQGQIRIEELLTFLAEQNDAKTIGNAELQWAKVLRGRVVEMVS